MKAARIHGYGDLGNVVIEDIPTPEFGPDEVLIRVEAASLNPLELLLLRGKRREVFPLSFPYTLGIDLAGTVEGAGPLAARWRKGDRVIARPDPVRGGAFARYAVVPATQVAAAPANLSLDEAAGLPTAAGTAWQALFEIAHLTRGQTVLIHAGAGGVLISITTPPDEALAKAHAVTAVRIANKTDATRLGLLSGLCDAGSLEVIIDRKLPLAEVELALRHQASGRARGKIILKPD